MTTAKQRHTNDFLVGITVIVATVAIVAGILWLKQSDLSGRTGDVVARTRDVGGASLGNPVMIRGVRAGTIKSIALGDKGWVVLHLTIDHKIRLPADPVVLLTASSLFGEWQATITESTGVPPDRELRAALAEARTRRDTLPGAVMPDIAQLTSVAGRLAGDVAKVTERVQVAFDDQAAKEIRQSIRHFAELSKVLSSTVTEQSRNLTQISGDVRTGLRTVNEAAARLNRFSGRADSATSNRELQQIVTNAQQASKDLVTAMTSLREAADGLGRTESRVASAMARSDSVLAKINSGRGSLGLMVNDPHLYQQSDSLLMDLRALVADVKKNPKRYINIRVF
ncbi:MAG: MlaD family protein [Gemmatimonadaceae bacterium]